MTEENKLLNKIYENRKDNSLLKLFSVSKNIEAKMPRVTEIDNLDDCLDFDMPMSEEQDIYPKFYSM